MKKLRALRLNDDTTGEFSLQLQTSTDERYYPAKLIVVQRRLILNRTDMRRMRDWLTKVLRA